VIIFCSFDIENSFLDLILVLIMGLLKL